MLTLDVITLFPEIFAATDYGILGRAKATGALSLRCHQLRDYALRADGRVDDRPYGGGPGMVLSYEPLRDAVLAIKREAPGAIVVLFCPRGRCIDQSLCVAQANAGAHYILICGRYEGVDQRFVDRYVDQLWSIGDFVLSGGEFAALVWIDAVARAIPGVVGDARSVQEDSFSHGLLDHDHYTRPAQVDGQPVPEELLSGDHQRIARWRQQNSWIRTCQTRQDLVKRQVGSVDAVNFEHNQPRPNEKGNDDEQNK